MSYRSDRGPTSRRTALHVQAREAWPWGAPELAVVDNPAVSPLSRSDISRATNSPAWNRKGSSDFEPEDVSHLIPIASKSSRSYSSDDARPSGLPRPAGNLSSILSLGRPSTSSSAHTLPIHMSTAAASSVSPKSKKAALLGDRPRNVLRRKAPFSRQTANQQTAVLGTVKGGSILSGTTTSSSNFTHGAQPNDDSSSRPSQNTPRPRGEDPRLRPPKGKASMRKEGSPSDRIPKEFAGLSTVINVHNLPSQPTPIFAPTGSPSTRYSESPGIWSSRNTTPTSLSSYSPGIVQPTKSAQRLRQPSPIQVPLLHPRSTAISPQPEESELRHFGSQSNEVSRTNSGSPGKTEQGKPLETDVNKKRTAVFPGTPPPRKSSMNFSSPNRKGDERSASDNARPLHPDSQLTSDLPVPSSSLAKPSARPLRPSRYRTDKPELKPSPVIDSQMPSDPTIPSSSLARPSARPVRPSRHGTDKLELKPSPVIQSNLATLRTTGHKRRESVDKIPHFERPRLTPVQSDGASVHSFQSSNSSRIPSHTTASSRLPTQPARALTKTLKETGVKPASIKRFGLFSKKSKPDLSGDNASLNDKHGRKGPAAGTGHEGYGRYAHSGRRTSVGSTSGASTRSVSTTRSGAQSASSRKGSVNSQPDLEIDDFFLDRLEPVVISGGGLDQSQLVRTQSGQSGQSAGSFSVGSNSTSSPVVFEVPSSFSGYSSESVRSSVDLFGQSPPPRNAASESPIAVDTETSQREPMPIKRWPFPRSQRHEFTVVGQSDAQGSMLPVPDGGHERTALRHPPTAAPRAGGELNEQRGKKTDKRSKGLKWNFFHRSHTTNQKTQPLMPLIPDAKSTAELHATVSPVPANRPVAHYALLEPDSDSLEEILHRIEESPPNEAEPTADTPTDLGLKKQHGESLLLPAPPAGLAEYMRPSERPSSPKVFFTKDLRRHGRLEPVGRIPQVVSRRGRDEKPTELSYALSDSLPAPHPGRCDDEYYTSGRPPLGIQTDVLPSRPFRPEPDTPKPSSAPGPDHVINLPPGPYLSGEFLTFSPRKQSQLSSSIRSGGEPILTAVSTIALHPELKTIEDEIWTEYDDLLDNMLCPDHPSVPEAGEALEMVTRASKTLQAELNAAGNPPTISISSETPPVVVAPNSTRSSGSSVRLRRSMIVSALHSSISPSPQMSFSDLIAGYGDGNRGSTDFSRLDASSAQGQAVALPSLAQTASAFMTDFESTRHRNALLFDIAERDREGAIAQTNLRSASLMTSRWLSFGRVLFSPAHNHIKSRDQERILVIDGLGNDDWSFYCALTYSNASVYSLSIRPMSSGSSAHPEAWQPPANHHLIHHGSVEDPFPFPKGFFAVCILRFPSTCSEAGQQNMVSECKRVLRQGGYLEMNILDLDLVNMGNRTRKAVRLLKERIYLADSDISLKPASDNIQRLLGRYGFDNLNRCMVSVPVAGTVVGSCDSSHSKVSDPAATVSTGRSSTSASTTDSQNLHKLPLNDAEASLGDLLSDPSPSASNDESIAKVVARVGRWWYTRCYEIPVLADGDLDRSIWADHKLLRECQKRGTGIRLLIAYAQKPSERRRTVSV